MGMDEIQKNKDKSKKQGTKGEDKFLSDFINKVIVCETMGGKTTTGILIGYDTYTIILVDMKDIKSTNPKKTMVFKHGLVSIRELE